MVIKAKIIIYVNIYIKKNSEGIYTKRWGESGHYFYNLKKHNANIK